MTPTSKGSVDRVETTVATCSEDHHGLTLHPGGTARPHSLSLFLHPSLFLEFMGDRDSPAWTGWLLAVLLFLSACLQTLFKQQYMYRVKVLQMRLRTAITGLVYRKVSPRGQGVRHACCALDPHTAVLFPGLLHLSGPALGLPQAHLFIS